ncbi:hypothetical protein BBAD15_g2226 [Beauveria bassiana D1-5]|uniref:F-box domain-containing protein n=1 Tax=Beauveria bassiana D1-5 TaxID=1245745 RepID=A0A0A2VVV2_BEABA|nr:hypothetical protein BBAD15_g2226 [Beauveria bassiana D1-5]
MTKNLKRKQSQELRESDDGATQPEPLIAREITPRDDKQPSQLARLPHELLLQILYPLLVHDEPLLLLPKARFVPIIKKSTTRGSAAWSPLVSILLACRATYFAGIQVFYGRNTLRFVEALHFRKLVETRLGYDQRFSVTSIRLDVAWQKRGRSSSSSSSSSSAWRLLHECDVCAEWRDVLDQLPNLIKIVVKNVTDFKKAELMAQVDVKAFEARMREEIGPGNVGLLTFEWPTGASNTE